MHQSKDNNLKLKYSYYRALHMCFNYLIHPIHNFFYFKISPHIVFWYFLLSFHLFCILHLFSYSLSCALLCIYFASSRACFFNGVISLFLILLFFVFMLLYCLCTLHIFILHAFISIFQHSMWYSAHFVATILFTFLHFNVLKSNPFYFYCVNPK